MCRRVYIENVSKMVPLIGMNRFRRKKGFPSPPESINAPLVLEQGSSL